MRAATSHHYVCWRSDEAHPYESLWSLLNKFCRWNCARYADVWSLFSTNTQPCPSKSRFVLANPSWIDRGKLRTLLRLSDEAVRQALVETYLGNNRASEALSASTHVRFCPKCIAFGFHSPLHDLLFIQACPIHREPLVVRCPSCADLIPNALPGLSNHDPYGCRCGHLFWALRQSPAFTADEIKRLQITADWVERVRPKLLAGITGFGRGGGRASRSLEHVAHFASYLTDLDPSLAPPSFILLDQDQKQRNTLITAASAPDCSEVVESDRLVSIYKAIARRITRLVRKRIVRAHEPSQRFCSATARAMRREPSNIALHAWRMFWEGVGRLESATLNTRKPRDRWRSQMLDRAQRMFSSIDREKISGWSQWTDGHLFGAACLGTFVECIKRAGEVEDTEHAGDLADSLTGEFVPFCLSNEDVTNGTKSLHLWLPQEFEVLKSYLR
jgi:hypothetical protein